jgi:hypothetical protein
MHRENLKRVKELQNEQQKQSLKKQKILNDYKKCWHREALTKHIQEEIQNELKQAIREGKDLDTYEFDQEKFKKLEEWKVIDDDTEVETEDAISIAYDLSEYGDAMVERLKQDKNRASKGINEQDLRQQLVAIIEENDEHEEEAVNEERSELSNNKDKIERPQLTFAQLQAYQKLLDKLNNKDIEERQTYSDDVSSWLFTTASTFSKRGQTFYSFRKIKDFLQRKAKEAKKTELEKQRIEEQETIKKVIEDNKKNKGKLWSIFNPLLNMKPVGDGKQIYLFKFRHNHREWGGQREIHEES